MEKPWTYFVKSIHADFRSEDQNHNTLVMTLSRDNKEVRLRFEEVRQLEIKEGFPYDEGIRILDITQFQWDGVKVRVEGLEPDSAIQFWARSVVRIQ